MILSEADDNFDAQWCDWVAYICDHGILVPVEQSCDEGVLLPTDQRALRLASCPDDMLKPLRWFFEICPAHVKVLVCHYIYWLVRLERARRTRQGHWRPGGVPGK